MAVNPLVPFTDTVTDGAEVAPIVTGNSLIDSPNPYMGYALSQQAWEQMHPQDQWDHIAEIVAPGDDDNEMDGDDTGNFNPGAGLDTSQVERGDSIAPPPVSQPQTDYSGPVDEGQLSPRQREQMAIIKAQQSGGIKKIIDDLDTSIKRGPFPNWTVEPDNTAKRKDSISYRWSEFGKGVTEAANKVFGINESDPKDHFGRAFAQPHSDEPTLADEYGNVVGLPAEQVPHVEKTQASTQTTIASEMGQASSLVGAPPVAAPPPESGIPVAKSFGLYQPAPEQWGHVSDDPNRVSSILQVARSMVDGSRSPENLVHAAYAAAGIELPDIPEFQLQKAERVELKDLKPGDLVRWNGEYDEARIGVYADNGKIIEKPFGDKRASVRDLSDTDPKSVTGYRVSAPKTSVSMTSTQQRAAFNQAVNTTMKLLGGLFADVSPKKSSSSDKSSSSSGGSSSGGTSTRSPSSGSSSPGSPSAPRSTGRGRKGGTSSGSSGSSSGGGGSSW